MCIPYVLAMFVCESVQSLFHQPFSEVYLMCLLLVFWWVSAEGQCSSETNLVPLLQNATQVLSATVVQPLPPMVPPVAPPTSRARQSSFLSWQSLHHMARDFDTLRTCFGHSGAQGPKGSSAQIGSGSGLLSPPGNRAISSTFAGDLLTKLHGKPGEKGTKIHWRIFKRIRRRRREIADFCPLSWSNVSWSNWAFFLYCVGKIADRRGGRRSRLTKSCARPQGFFKNLLMPLFLMCCFPVDFQEVKRPLTTKSVKRPIKVGKRPINEGKRPINTKVLVGVSVGCLMGCFRAPPPWRKTAPLKRPIKRPMNFGDSCQIGFSLAWMLEVGFALGILVGGWGQECSGDQDLAGSSGYDAKVWLACLGMQGHQSLQNRYIKINECPKCSKSQIANR